MVAYTYGKSYDITNGIRNSMESNCQLNQSLNPNNPSLTYSNFDIRHRIIAQFGYTKAWKSMGTTTISGVFNAQSGNPFTWGFVNGTLANTPQAAGLAYIFKDEAEAARYLVDDDKLGSAAVQAKAFMDFVNGDSYLKTRKGDFTQRNGGRTPWNTSLDLKILHTIKVKESHDIQISLDIINATNLINPNWGRIYFSPNTFNSTANLGLVRTNSGSADPLFKFSAPPTPYTIDQLASRWQMQLGLRYSF